MSIIIRLQNLPLEANSLDIRRFFQGLQIPDGGVHIVGGENGDAFIAFANDEDARQAMERNGNLIKGSRIKLLLSSRNEMQRVIDAARNQTISILPSSTKTTMNPNAAAPAASVVPTNIPVQQSSPQKLPPPSSSSIQPQQYPTHPIGNYPTTQYPPAVQIQPSLASSTNPVATSGYYPGGVGPSQTVRYPPPPPQSSSQTQPQSQPTPNDYQRSGPNVAYGHRQNDRQELQYRGRSRSRSRSPPTNRTGSDIHPSMNQRYSDMNKNTMQTGLIRSLQPSVSSSTSQISPSSSTQIHSSNFVPQTSGNNMDIRYTNYPQPSQQQQQESREYQSQQSFGGSQYRPMPGASNVNNNTMMDGSLGGGGDRGIVGGTGIGQQGITIQGGGVVGGGWNNNNDNNNYRQTSVISNDFNNRKMDSIHQLPQQQQSQPLSSAYGQPSTMPMMPHQSQQQQQQQQQLIRPPTSQQQQQQPPPQQMFTLQLNDLPFNVKSLDLIKFFQPLYLDEDNIKIFYDSKGFPTGIALVRFGSPKEWEQALTFNNRYMGDRRIQVQPLDDLGNNNNNNNNSNIGQNSSTIINNNNNGPLLQQPPPPPLIANPPPSNSSASTTIGQQRKNTLPPPQSDPYRSSLDNYPTYRNSPEEIGSFGRGPPPPSSSSSSSLQQSSSQFNGGMGPPPPSSSSSQSSSSSSSHHHNSSNHHHHHHHRGKYQPRCKDNALFMKGLPFANCTTKDVAHFFDPIKLFHIEIEFDSRNKPTGNAYVEFHDRQDVDHAMNYNMRNMGHRYIELIPWIFYEKFGPTYHLPSAPPPPKFMRGNNSGGSRGGGPPPPPPSYGGSGGGNHHHHQGPFTHCVLVRGLGKHVSTPDLKQFFAKSNIDTYAVHIMLTTDKMNAGEAFVEFLTKEDQNRALDMSGARLAGERVNIRPVAYEVVRASVPPPRGPPSSSGMPSLPPNKSHGGKYRRGGPAGPRGGNNNNGQSAPIFDKSSILIMKNISFKTNIDDLCRFFDDYHITPNRIKIRPSTSNDSSSSSSLNDPNNLDGQEAQIQFHSRLDAEHAVRTLDKQYLHDRKIYLTFL